MNDGSGLLSVTFFGLAFPSSTTVNSPIGAINRMCSIGDGNGCIGFTTLAILDRLAPNREALQKILSGNARRILRLG